MMEFNESSKLPENLWEFCFNASSVKGNGSFSPPSDSAIFWVEGLGLTLTGLVGIFGNSMTVAVLHRISLNNVFNQLIVMLCLSDSLFAGFSLMEYGLRKGLKIIQYTTPIYVNLWPTLVYPLHNVTFTVSLYITLAIAIER